MTGRTILEALIQKEGQVSDVVLQSSGHILSPSSPVPEDATVVATLRLLGGKGGFGSMLRAIGAQIEKTTNREACRDLSGRRLRDINEEKRLKDFISKKAEREREIQERKRQKFEKLKETPKHIFQDDSYYQQRELREKNLFDSLDKAFETEIASGSSSVKRHHSKSKDEAVTKAKKGRFMDDLDVSSEDSESDDEASSEKGNSSSDSEKGKQEKDDTSIKNGKCGESSSCSENTEKNNDRDTGDDSPSTDDSPPANSSKRSGSDLSDK